MSTSEKLVALGKAYAERLAREHLLDFATRTMPWFETPKHIRFLAELFERIERGEIKRLAISAPPGHGKSSLTQALVAYAIGRNPKRRVLALSGNESLARRNSRAIRSIVQSPDWPFPEVKLIGESLEEWHTEQLGGVRAIGRFGQTTGFRSELCLLDDIQADAGTPMSREDDEVYVREIVSTRLEPDGCVILIATRWAEDDLIGRLEEGSSANQWVFVNLPAIATASDVLGRAPGEALWPERWPLDSLQERKAEVGSIAFSCGYLGQPIPPEGRMIQRSWFGAYAPEAIPRMKKIVFGLDGAAKTHASSDNSAIGVLGVANNNDIYLLDVIAAKVEFVDLIRLLKTTYARWKTEDVPLHCYIEDASSGTQLVQTLKREAHFPVTAVKVRDSKVSRVEALTPLFESGRVLLPTHASWLGAFLEELLSFPVSRRDDRVDCVCLALAQLATKNFVGLIASTGPGGGETYDSAGNVVEAWGDMAQQSGPPAGTNHKMQSIMRSGVW